MKRKKLPLRRNVCMLVFNKNGKLFLGERAGKVKGKWQFPQGGVEPTLRLKQNVYKELLEELGLQPQHIGKLVKLKARHSYEWDTPPAYARGKWRGQRQTFWLVEFLGKNSDINLEADEEPELQSWKWCTPNQVLKLAEEKRIPGYLAPLAEVEPLLNAVKSTSSGQLIRKTSKGRLASKASRMVR
jgi:putative (di)nucleoside polyphosphate hydrolase